MKYVCEFCGKTFNSEFNALAHERNCAGTPNEIMSSERRNAVNEKLSALWYEYKMNPYETFRADAALELAGYVQCLWLLGYGVTGADAYGHLIQCPAVAASPAEVEFIPLLLQKSI